MWCTYGMSGQWVQGRPDKHASAIIQTKIESVRPRSDANLIITFRDPRHFGTLKFVRVPEEGKAFTEKKLSTLGPDMLGEDVSIGAFHERLLRKPQHTLAQVLMDQSIVSGVGNYIKAEALYRARLSPHRVVTSLNPTDVSVLHSMVIAVMQESYRAKGATLKSYRTTDGETGDAQFKFHVYGRKTDDQGNVVVKEETLDKRVTHWVPVLQT